ncbi:TonB-dependent receptor [Salinisphaera hydrothermalis]|uniref:TonB-dependent receptor n=1 Tax=Salinisphaera hydrothermalis TaxID=563188 RepID=UPI0012EBBCDF|nr:TonB-dependent siderophore receptor [Salinisphaera hydrothermalis]
MQRVGTVFGVCVGVASLPAWAASSSTDTGHRADAPAPAAPAAPADAAAPAPSEPTTQFGTVHVQGQVTGGDRVPPAYAGGQIATGGRIGVLGEKNAANVPFSVVSFTSQLINNQQDGTLAGVLENDAAVQSSNGYGNFAQTFQIRGFNFDGDDVSFGGLYGVLPRQIVQTNYVNRVELFKGANAFAKGVGPGGSGVGGAVNLEPKRATDKPITRLRLGYASDSQFEQSLDVGRRYGRNDQYGARLNVQHESGDTAINKENANDTSAAIALDYRGGRGHVALDFGYQRQHIDHGRSTVRVGDATTIPAAPDAETNYWPEFANTELKSEFGMLSGAFDITDDWTAYAAFGGNHSHESGDYGQPVLSSPDSTGYQVGDATVSRLTVVRATQTYTGQAGFRGHFDTGPISHDVNLGYSGYYQRADSAYNYSGSVDTNLYQPATIDSLPTIGSAGDLNDPNVVSRTHANGWALSDTAGLFDDRLLVTVGARYQSLSIRNYDYNNADQASGKPIIGHRVSPVYGVVYKPTSWLSLYANHIEALQPGDTAPATAQNPGQTLGILHAKQDEVGAKLDFGRIGGSLALYQIKKPNAYLDPKTQQYGYFGEQRNRGVELNIHGQPTRRLKLLASATYVDPRLTQTPGDQFNGNDAVGVPNYRVALSGDWQLPGAPHWHANARVIRTGSQYADQANDLKVDAWTRVDLGLRYNMPWGNDGRSIVWRANVENVANSSYWSSVRRIASTNYLTQGDPRTFKLSATFNFD